MRSLIKTWIVKTANASEYVRLAFDLLALNSLSIDVRKMENACTEPSTSINNMLPARTRMPLFRDIFDGSSAILRISIFYGQVDSLVQTQCQFSFVRPCADDLINGQTDECDTDAEGNADTGSLGL